MPSRSRRKALRHFAMMALATVGQVRGGEKPAPDLVYLVTRQNGVQPIELEPKMSLLVVILRLGGYSYKGFKFHLWRHTQRKPVTQPHNLGKIVLQSDDVIIEGALDEARAKFIERIPEISAALKLPPDAPPAELDKVFDF